MNGSLYISFFQGQLESALEQVVQLAVTEITGTVGTSLSAMLLETARKEQENQRLRATIKAVGPEEKARGKSAELVSQHAALGPPAQHALPDSFLQEQKRRAVGQLKVVMERVLQFAVRELSKVVEDSFDDVLLELRKTEQENKELIEKLHGVAEEDGAVEVNKSQEERAKSPKCTDGVKGEERTNEEERGKENRQNTEVISVSQDWVPVLDQVFGQKWCSDVWPFKEVVEVKAEPRLSELIREDAALPRTRDSLSDHPQWLREPGALTLTFDPQQTSETSLTDDVPLKSPSMLQRLLTLPSQLLDDEDEMMETDENLLNAITSLHGAQTPHQDSTRADERNGVEDQQQQEEEGQEEEPKLRSCRSGRKNHSCNICGRKFSRAHLLKAHWLTHKEARSLFSKLHTCAGSGKAT